MLKAEKVAFVEREKEEMKGYRVVGIMPIDALPDRLFQKIRNDLKPDTKIVVARRSLLERMLGENTKKLLDGRKGNVAILISKKDPLELYESITSNRIKLIAKPGQISPQDIVIEQGETSIPPGQGVTDLKTAGIDVQIQKGKVVISKTKVLVAKGAKISVAVSKALKLLDIMPFEAQGRVSALLADGIVFTEKALGITPAVVLAEIAKSFGEANALTVEIGYPTKYNIEGMISKAFASALHLGVERKIYEKETVEKLLGIASLEASSVNAIVKESKE